MRQWVSSFGLTLRGKEAKDVGDGTSRLEESGMMERCRGASFETRSAVALRGGGRRIAKRRRSLRCVPGHTGTGEGVAEPVLRGNKLKTEQRPNIEEQQTAQGDSQKSLSLPFSERFYASRCSPSRNLNLQDSGSQWKGREVSEQGQPRRQNFHGLRDPEAFAGFGISEALEAMALSQVQH